MREPSRNLTLALPGILALALACSGEASSGSNSNPASTLPAAAGSDGTVPGTLPPGSPEIDPVTGEPITGTPGTIGDGTVPGTNGPGGSDLGQPSTGTPGTQPGVGTNPDGTPVNPDGSTPTVAEATCPTQALSPTPLRRLTSYEYGNSARDLLGVEYDVEAELPADEKVMDGYSNNAAVLTVADLHAEKYMLVSEELARLADVATLAPCDGVDPTACALNFARTVGRKAFRRPITSDDEAVLMAAYDAGATGGSYEEGIQVMIRAMLQSPHFIYRLETSAPPEPAAALLPLSQYELATRLSYLVWASGPDDALLDAAERGELATREQVAAKTREMLADPRANRGLLQFYAQWLGFSKLDILSKNQSLFPAYSSSVRDAMAAEFPAFLQYVLSSAQPTLRELLTSQVAFVSAPLAPIYGVESTSATPTMVTLPEEQGRAGVLTQAGFLAVQAHPDQTSPVLRGKTVRARMLCTPVPPPPDDVNITIPDVNAAGTARERFSQHLDAGDSCATCHSLMDPIGFAFENFDAIGQYRTTENGQTIDVSGDFGTPAELAGEFNGVREMAEKLADSPVVSDCVATEWFRFASGRKETPADGCSLDTLRQGFAASGSNLNELVVAMTQTDAFWFRAPIADEVTQ